MTSPTITRGTWVASPHGYGPTATECLTLEAAFLQLWIDVRTAAQRGRLFAKIGPSLTMETDTDGATVTFKYQGMGSAGDTLSTIAHYMAVETEANSVPLQWMLDDSFTDARSRQLALALLQRDQFRAALIFGIGFNRDITCDEDIIERLLKLDEGDFLAAIATGLTDDYYAVRLLVEA